MPGPPGASRPSGWVVLGAVQTPAVARSGREGQCAQSSQGGAEMVLPGPPSGEMQLETAGRVGDASGEGE